MIRDHYILTVLILISYIILQSCGNSESSPKPLPEVAFLGDVHFHDVFAEFQDGAFEGLLIRAGNEDKRAVVRTMEAQLTSTRLFNENYFTFLAALDDIVERGIRYVAFPGDFTDDGQPLHLRGFREILQRYERDHGLRFFIAPGNHDPVRPFNLEAGKRDFLGTDGMAQPIFSTGHPLCTGERVLPDNLQYVHEPVCSDEVVEFGYQDLLQYTSEFGFTPREEDLYFETPFSSYSYDDYSFETALFAAEYENRLYEICHEGSGGIFREEHFTSCFYIMDMSYLIEPEDGLWLLSIDGNVYIPRADADTSLLNDPSNFSGPGNAGFNAVITHKRHLLDWISDVTQRAASLGKTVYAFSHYPTADFYNGAEPFIEELWGEGRFQLARMPSEYTSQTLARHGLQIHVGAHMHMNDTNVYHDEDSGKTLFNIQTPSIAGYVPAYKILRSNRGGRYLEVETSILDDVPGFDTLFPLYETEWETLYRAGSELIWNRSVLESASYREYTDWHMKELSRLRFLPREWPEDIRILLSSLNGFELLIFVMQDKGITYEEVIKRYERAVENGFTGEELANELIRIDGDDFDKLIDRANNRIQNEGFVVTDFNEWNGSDLSIDFYRLRNAGSLAHRDIPPIRMDQYRFLANLLNDTFKDSLSEEKKLISYRLKILLNTMMLFDGGEPDQNFRIDLYQGTILGK